MTDGDIPKLREHLRGLQRAVREFDELEVERAEQYQRRRTAMAREIERARNQLRTEQLARRHHQSRRRKGTTQ